jgi:hypothetical protein
MRIRVYLSAVLAMSAVIGIQAQNEADALRYSYLQPQGTARSMGMGNAFGALGADLWSLSSNPAGIALYRKNEFSLSPGVYSSFNKSEYMNTPGEDLRSAFQFSSIGIIGAYEGGEKEIRGLAFGVGYNKLKSFQDNLLIQGSTSNTSLLDVFANQALGTDPNDIYSAFPFGAALAYDTYLINPVDSIAPFSYYTEIPYGEVAQRKALQRRGSMGETVLSGGANILDKWYFGLTLAFPSVRFRENGIYTETVQEADIALDNFTFTDELLTTGSGFTLKAGAVYRASEWLRLGLAIHTPSWLSLHDVYASSMSSRFKDGENYDYASPEGNYHYSLRTPPRYLVNAAFIVGISGVISADYEYVNYSQARLSASQTLGSDNYDFRRENDAIQSIYRGTHNVRAGLEWRLAEIWRLRGGMAFSQSPFVNGVTDTNPYTLTYSGGAGIRLDRFFADFVVMLRQSSSDYYLYNPELVDPAAVERAQSLVGLTVGMRY